MAAQDIFDFETIIPAAVKFVLTNPDIDLNAWIISDRAEFQKVRPRVEIVYRHLGEANPRQVIILSNGQKRGTAFAGELKLYAITDADEPGKTRHSDYRAIIRAQLAGLQEAVNSEFLKFHKIQWLQPGNEETGIRTQDNYQQTTFPFQVMLTIQKDAWELI